MTEERIISLVNNNYFKKAEERERDILRHEKAKEKRLTRRYTLYLMFLILIMFAIGINL